MSVVRVSGYSFSQSNTNKDGKLPLFARNLDKLEKAKEREKKFTWFLDEAKMKIAHHFHFEDCKKIFAPSLMQILSENLFAIFKMKMIGDHASLTILWARSWARAQWTALLNSLSATEKSAVNQCRADYCLKFET